MSYILMLLFAMTISGPIGGFKIGDPIPTNEPYYIGLQNLGCVIMWGGEYTAVNPGLSNYSPYHSIIKFKNTIFEWGFEGFHWGAHPRSNCEVSWEPTLIQSIFRNDVVGESNHSITNVIAFGKIYEFIKGEYDLFLNNCHMFTNTLSNFLTTNVNLVNCSRVLQPAPVVNKTTIPSYTLSPLLRQAQEMMRERGIMN